MTTLIPELEADIYYLPAEEGGRKHGAFSGYRGQFYYYGRDWDAMQLLIDKETCPPGETVRVYLQMLSPECHVGMFHVGQEFEIREGARIVGKGVIRAIFRPDFECKVDWSKLKEEIYFEDGSLRDIYALNTTADDWKKWIEWVVRSGYRVEYRVGGMNQPARNIDFSAISNYWENRANQPIPTIRVFVDHIQINAHFFCEEEIENDITPTNFQCWGDHVRLMNYMDIMSYVLKKEVVLTAENVRDHVLLRVTG